MPRMEWLGRELVRDPPPPSLYPGFPALDLIALIAPNIVLLSLDRHQLNIMASGYGINGGAKAPFLFLFLCISRKIPRTLGMEATLTRSIHRC